MDNTFDNIEGGLEKECNCPACNREINEKTMEKNVLSTMKVDDLQVGDMVLVADEAIDENLFSIHHPILYYIYKTDDDARIIFEIAHSKKHWPEIFNLDDYVLTMVEVLEEEYDFCIDNVDIEEEDCMLLQFHHHFKEDSLSKAVEFADMTIRTLHRKTFFKLIQDSLEQYQVLNEEESA